MSKCIRVNSSSCFIRTTLNQIVIVELDLAYTVLVISIHIQYVFIHHALSYSCELILICLVGLEVLGLEIQEGLEVVLFGFLNNNLL
jgi:hypothetical protein